MVVGVEFGGYVVCHCCRYEQDMRMLAMDLEAFMLGEDLFIVVSQTLVK